DLFFFSSRRRHTRFSRDWSSDVCSSDLTRQRHPQESVLIRGGRLVRLDGERKPHLGRERAVSDACNVVHAMVAVEWIGTRAFDGEDIILDHNVDVLPLHTSDLDDDLERILCLEDLDRRLPHPPTALADAASGDHRLVQRVDARMPPGMWAGTHPSDNDHRVSSFMPMCNPGAFLSQTTISPKHMGSIQ